MNHQQIFFSIAVFLYPLIGVLTGRAEQLPGYFFGLIVGYACTALYVMSSRKWKYLKH